MASSALKSSMRMPHSSARVSASRGRLAVKAKAGADNARPVSRRVLVGLGAATTALVAVPLSSKAKDSRKGEVYHTEKEWLEILGQESYTVMRQEGTERPRTSPLNFEKRKGTFVCAGCDSALFDSSAKFESGTGWPSFYEALPGAVDETSDFSIVFMPRTEVRCHRCQGHLGHVFDDGPAPTGLRYCMNGRAMQFKPADA